MDVTSIIGFLLAVVLIVIVGIGPSSLGNFWDPQSVAIVIGGAIAAVVASYPLNKLSKIPGHFKLLVQGNKYNMGALLNTLEEMAQLARKNGLLALEEKANEIDDPFFKQGIMLIVDATEPEDVRSMLENELEAMADRHADGANMYAKASAFAPAFGMIGTLVGLINMLKGMNLDEGGSSNIGPAMSVALVTTFYGCVLANVLFTPIGNKLNVRNEEEMLYKQVIIEGILAIQAGDNPKFLKEKLVTYLAQKSRAKVLGAGGGGAQAAEEPADK